MNNVVFITGTDTGVGKTLLTALLLCQARDQGCQALAMKPFCSGTRADIRLLQSLQNHFLPDDWINPYFFSRPVAPLACWRRARHRPRLTEVLTGIKRVQQQCESLIVEGSGGLMVPLSPNYLVLDLVNRLECPAVVVARNRLGTINHTLLTVRSMQVAGIKEVAVVLMGEKRPDISAGSNLQIITDLVAPIPVLSLPFLGCNIRSAGRVRKICKKMKKKLARLLDLVHIGPVLLNGNRLRKKIKKVVDSRNAAR